MHLPGGLNEVTVSSLFDVSPLLIFVLLHVGGAAATDVRFPSLSIGMLPKKKKKKNVKGGPSPQEALYSARGLCPRTGVFSFRSGGFRAPVTEMRKFKHAECLHGMGTVLSHLKSLFSGSSVSRPL